MEKIPYNVASFFVHFMKKQKLNYIICILASLTTALSSSIWPFITGKLIDELSDYKGAKENVFSELSMVFIGAFLFWVLIEVLARVQGYVIANIYPKFEANIRMSVFRYVNYHSHSYFIKNFVGSISNRIAELPKSASLVIDFVFNNLFPLVVAILISSALFGELNPNLSAILLGWLVLHLTVCTYAGLKAANYSREHSNCRSELQGRIVDSLNNNLNVKLYSNQEYEISYANKMQEDEISKNKRTLFYLEGAKMFMSIVAIICLSYLYWVTVNYWKHDIISLGDMIFVMSSTLNILSLAWTATVEMAYLFRELGVIKQALKIISEPHGINDRSTKKLNVTNGTIEFKKVTFNYRRNSNVFKEKTLTIKGGERIGLVGLSGSGKTTFASLIMRLFDIDSGEILIDGQNISDVSLRSLRDSISFIPQEPMLFHRSVMDNIQYAKLDANANEVIKAAVEGNCHDFITSFEDGYETVVGERASKISGGQKQRIAIARAILKNSKILIMDEATSALDLHTEKQVKESVYKLSEGRTTIVIAHRLNTLREMDRILVFDGGTIIEDGTHEELMNNKGYYHSLWGMQTSGLLSDDVMV